MHAVRFRIACIARAKAVQKAHSLMSCAPREAFGYEVLLSIGRRGHHALKDNSQRKSSKQVIAEPTYMVPRQKAGAMITEIPAASATLSVGRGTRAQPRPHLRERQPDRYTARAKHRSQGRHTTPGRERLRQVGTLGRSSLRSWASRTPDEERLRERGLDRSATMTARAPRASSRD
jgi:hypothetical protein